MKIILEAKSPILISQKEFKTNYTKSLDYIPGSTLFGAILNKKLQNIYSNGDELDLDKIYKTGYLSQESNITEKYKKWIDDGISKYDNISVSDFLPLPRQESLSFDTDINNSFKDLTPPLMSIMKCRVHENHLTDSMIYNIKKWYAQFSGIETKNQFSFYAPPKCPINECHAPLKKKALKIYIDKDDNWNPISTNIKAKINIGIDGTLRSSGSFKGKGALFTQEFIEKGEKFSGTIVFNSEKTSKEEITDIINNIQVGARRNAGFGKLELVHSFGSSVSPNIPTMEQAIDDLSIKYQNNYAQLCKWIPLLTEHSKVLIPFYLYSHTPVGFSSELKTFLDSFGKTQIYFLSSKKQIHRLRNQVKRKWLYFKVYTRGSIGIIYINKNFENDGFKELWKKLAEIEITKLGNTAHKGLGEIHFLPNIFFSPKAIIS